MNLIRRYVAAIFTMTIVQLFALSAFAFHEDPSVESPFVICTNQTYALCAAASCFVYNGVAYCQCDVLKGDSISLQLDFSTPTGEKNVCDVNAQGKTNGFMVSTFSLPADVLKGGSAAVYTCPGNLNAGIGGSPAPVAYGQCDGGICFTSTSNKTFPGFDGKLHQEIICSCPISTGATPGSSNPFGYQIFGPFQPKAPVGNRCQASGCAACSVPNPSANGSIIPVGAPTGVGKFLTEQLTGSIPTINECLCECPADGPCTVRENKTQ